MFGILSNLPLVTQNEGPNCMLTFICQVDLLMLLPSGSSTCFFLSKSGFQKHPEKGSICKVQNDAWLGGHVKLKPQFHRCLPSGRGAWEGSHRVKMPLTAQEDNNQIFLTT